jgi:hypothetical protein
MLIAVMGCGGPLLDVNGRTYATAVVRFDRGYGRRRVFSLPSPPARSRVETNSFLAQAAVGLHLSPVDPPVHYPPAIGSQRQFLPSHATSTNVPTAFVLRGRRRRGRLLRPSPHHRKFALTRFPQACTSVRNNAHRQVYPSTYTVLYALYNGFLNGSVSRSWLLIFLYFFFFCLARYFRPPSPHSLIIELFHARV